MKKRLFLGVFLAAAALGMVASCASIQKQSDCATAHANYIVLAASAQQCVLNVKCLMSPEDHERLNLATAKVTVLCHSLNLPAHPAVVDQRNDMLPHAEKMNREKFIPQSIPH